VSDFSEWDYNRNLDDGCSLRFATTGTNVVSTLISELATDVWVYLDGVLEQRFRITEINQTWDEDGQDSVDVSAICYRRIFSARHVRTPLSFIGTSQGAIVFDLIQHAQAATGGDYGITLGDSGPTILRDREYEPGQNILQAILDFTTIEDPLAWEINGDLELFITTPQSFPIRDIPIQIGFNASSMSRPSGTRNFGNVSVVVGDVESTTPIFEEAPNLSVDPRGRWEVLNAFPQISSQSELQEQAEGLLFGSRSPLAQWTVTMDVDKYFSDSKYEIGDFVRVVQPRSTVYTVGQSAPSVLTQVISIDVSQDSDGDTQVKLAAIEVPEPPGPLTWDKVSATLIWDDVDPTITWNNYLVV
jgi:hypothetical protein